MDGMSPSNTAEQRATTTDCRRWPVIWFLADRPSLLRSAEVPRHWQQRSRRCQFQSFFKLESPGQSWVVESLSRPGGNLTGIANLAVEVGPKRLELLHQLVPTATVIAVLINPTRTNVDTETRELQAAANQLRIKLYILHASADGDFDTVFTHLVELHAGGLVISGDPFFNSRSEQLAALAIRHGVPAVYQFHEFAAAGGLVSYGSSITNTHRLAGIYTGRILKGEKPAELPVQQSTKVELIINLKTAKDLGLEVPPTLLARADEVIE